VVNAGILPLLTTLMGSTQHEGILLESARVFVQITLLKKDDLKEAVIRDKGLEAMKLPLESKHDILKNEVLDAFVLLAPLAAHNPQQLEVMTEGLSAIFEGENEDLSAKALGALAPLVHKQTFEAFTSSKLFPLVEKLAATEGPLKQPAADILASNK